MSYAALTTAEILPFPIQYDTRSPLARRATAAPLNILLVEDDASDAMLTEIALDAANFSYQLHTLRSGAEVLPYLRGLGKYRHAPKPDMLMLDLSLPSKDGFEVLAELSASPERYGDLPIVILTGDMHCAFLKHSYGLNIAMYMTKPCSVEKIQEALVAVRRAKRRRRG